VKKDINLSMREWLELRRVRRNFNKLLNAEISKSGKNSLSLRMLYFRCSVASLASDVRYVLNPKNWW